MIQRTADFLQLSPNVVLTVAGIFVVLIVGSAARAVAVMLVPAEQRRQRLASLRTWWILWFLFALSVLLGRATAVLFFAVASYLGLREFLELAVPDRKERNRVRHIMWAVPLHYLAIYFAAAPLIWTIVPVGCGMWLCVRIVMADQPVGFTHRVATAYWGVMLTVFLVSHAPLLLLLPETANPVGGPVGWLVYLVLLTQLCDISQALWGRALGRRKITPHVSPNKTWEGLSLGIATTLLLAVVFAPWLTPWSTAPQQAAPGIPASIPYGPAMAAGLLVAIAGFFGDITMSAIKRDAGVKDSSALLPGQGGALDRIDSLSFTAPAFFYFVRWLYG